MPDVAMAKAAPTFSLVVGADPQSEQPRTLAWLLPALIGVSAPMVLAMLFAPSMMVRAEIIVLIVALTAAFVVATIAFGAALLLPASVSTAVFDRERRSLDIYRSSIFATRVSSIPFDRIKAVRMTPHYDDDGYSVDVPELVLVDGSAQALPGDTSVRDIAAIRALLGLA
jgi:hypothetical protein